MKILRSSVGRTAGHIGQGSTNVDSYTLDTGQGLSVTVWTYGASLVEVRVPDRDGVLGNVVLRLPNLRMYEDPEINAYIGATVGRYCRCVRNGRFSLDGVEYELDHNDGSHHLHGGSLGFDKYVWTADAETVDDRMVLRMVLQSPDGDQGYPGALTAEIRYEVDADSRLSFDFQATTTASTITGFTNHAFWNLGGPGHTVDDHQLTLNSSRFVAFDNHLMPLSGPPRLLVGTPLDFQSAREVGVQRVDNFYVLDDEEWAAELVHPRSGRRMRVTTDQPGIGVYTGDHYRLPRAGICLETGAWPDAPNRPDFPSVRLDPGQTYRHHTTHEFHTIGEQAL
ncbi:galactose mutarotase [Streptomyces triticagri]|uniref:Aldose 1-epimerase n=1 Tax=Streptomyces triticagri TaxID=2293568 RepID=A0A372M6Q6_9ACTN|nr:galactose mutarotase [Streptomyces triticagri]